MVIGGDKLFQIMNARGTAALAGAGDTPDFRFYGAVLHCEIDSIWMTW